LLAHLVINLPSLQRMPMSARLVNSVGAVVSDSADIVDHWEEQTSATRARRRSRTVDSQHDGYADRHKHPQQRKQWQRVRVICHAYSDGRKADAGHFTQTQRRLHVMLSRVSRFDGNTKPLYRPPMYRVHVLGMRTSSSRTVSLPNTTKRVSRVHMQHCRPWMP